MDKKQLLNLVIVALVVYLGMTFLFPKNAPQENSAPFSVSTTKKEYPIHEEVHVKIHNNTEKAVTVLTQACPTQPLEVVAYKKGNWNPLNVTTDITCETTPSLQIQPNSETEIKFGPWNGKLFGELGKYKIKVTINKNSAGPIEKEVIESNEFDVVPQGWFSIFWTTAFYQPIYNSLIYIISVVPGKDLGFAIIILTILIRTILLIPSQKALKSQRKMQELQPHLKKVQEKHKNNQEMLAKETMNLWKEHKVNPFGSCLPLIIQIPILFALYHVIQNGLNPSESYLLYEPLKNFSIHTIHTVFLNILPLTKVNFFVLPLIVGGLQFLQMKLALLRKGNNSEKDTKKKEKSVGTEMEMASQMMVYIMPVMIAVFTASVPAGVGLYWATSTIYGIFQQLVVNKQVDAYLEAKNKK